MKILVFSDTHDQAGGDMVPFIEAFEKEVDAVIFLGDGSYDATIIEDNFLRLPFYRVRGNCDFSSYDPLSGAAAFGGVVIFYTHGHEFGVKRSLDQLYRRGKEAGADVILYGHTHAPHYEKRGDIHLFSPGSLLFPRGRARRPSYGLITIENEEPTFEVVER